MKKELCVRLVIYKNSATEQVGRSGDGPNDHPGGTRFESYLGRGLSPLRIFVFFQPPGRSPFIASVVS
jgi:hypothetical protein